MNLLQLSQLRQHCVFRHVSVRERQRLRLCGQDHCGAFVRLYWQPTSKRAIVQWRPTAQQKRLYLYHQGEFQHQNCTVGTVHDSDHEGVVRIFVRHSYHSNELFTLITRHNFSYTRSVITRHNFSPTRSVIIQQSVSCAAITFTSPAVFFGSVSNSHLCVYVWSEKKNRNTILTSLQFGLKNHMWQSRVEKQTLFHLNAL